MNRQNAVTNAAAESKRGEETLAEAKHLSSGGFFNGAISRAYYAAFHFARALLFLKRLEPKTHKGVLQLLSLHYVKPRLLEEDIADYLARLETFRELSDYNAVAEFTAEEARKKIQQAEEFVAACRRLLKAEGIE